MPVKESLYKFLKGEHSPLRSILLSSYPLRIIYTEALLSCLYLAIQP